MAIDISIIIVSWNVKDFLHGCLSSIYRHHSDVNFEVFVVDNGSADGSAEMVKSEFSQARLIQNKENLGFARANNSALKNATGRLVLFLNPDTEIFEDTLQLIIRAMDTHPDWAGLGCKLLSSDGSLQPSCRHFPSLFTDLMECLCLSWLFPKSRFFNYYKMGDWAHDETRSVDVPYGACLVVRRGILDKTGPMDERFFMYYDEIDLCYRIKKCGGSIWYSTDIEVIHHGNKSSNQVPAQVSAWKQRSKVHFFEKHYGWWSVYALGCNLILSMVIVWVVFGLGHLFFSRPRDLQYIKNNVRASWKEYLAFFQEKNSL